MCLPGISSSFPCPCGILLIYQLALYEITARLEITLTDFLTFGFHCKNFIYTIYNKIVVLVTNGKREDLDWKIWTHVLL